MDDRHVAAGGRRYTNYRLYQEWEGSKSFACRADIDILSPSFNVVCAEGIIDLIQIEKTFYTESRWNSNHIGLATCGATHDAILRQIVSVGIINQNLDLYIDNKSDGTVDPVLVGDARKLPTKSPFFSNRDYFKMSVYRNGFKGEKDFGIPRDKVDRKLVKL